jgi:hypothetical protein
LGLDRRRTQVHVALRRRQIRVSCQFLKHKRLGVSTNEAKTSRFDPQFGAMSSLSWARPQATLLITNDAITSRQTSSSQ